jgi:AcrR family transcriptional regulator
MQSLRERKKAQTKVAIQEQALRLFVRRGYDATTIEQIAEAAEVSPSTFFRYFPTKEAVVLYDSLDPIIITTFRNQPRDTGVIRTLRNTIRETFAGLSPEKRILEQKRGELVLTVPELRAAMLDELARNIDAFTMLIAERVGRPADDVAVRNCAGAIIGVVVSATLGLRNRPLADYLQAIDGALAQLESSLAI